MNSIFSFKKKKRSHSFLSYLLEYRECLIGVAWELCYWSFLHLLATDLVVSHSPCSLHLKSEERYMLQINCRKISKCKILISQCLLKSVKQVGLLPCTSRGQNRGSDNTVLLNVQQVYSIYYRNSSVGEFSL